MQIMRKFDIHGHKSYQEIKQLAGKRFPYVYFFRCNDIYIALLSDRAVDEHDVFACKTETDNNITWSSYRFSRLMSCDEIAKHDFEIYRLIV